MHHACDMPQAPPSGFSNQPAHHAYSAAMQQQMGNFQQHIAMQMPMDGGDWSSTSRSSYGGGGGVHHGGNRPAMMEDDGMQAEVEKRRNGSGAQSHTERTQEKWEMLLRAKPDDPMAFYWREMIQWCKVRGNGMRADGVEVAGVKRGCQSLRGLQMEEGIDAIDRLVKRIRCDDDSASSSSPLSGCMLPK